MPSPACTFFARKNCAFCFMCDRRAMNVVDFTMKVFESRGQPSRFKDALRWLGSEFHLPMLEGRPAGITGDKQFRVGVGGPFEYFVRSDLYATLSKPAKIIYSVIRDLSDRDLKARVSYRTLRRHSGIGSDHTIKDALDELVAIHLLEIRKSHAGSLEPFNVYRLTPDDPAFLELANQSCQSNREAITAEVEYYREERLARRRKPKPEPEPEPTTIHS